MNIKRILLIGFEVIVVFVVVWLLVQLPEMKQNANLNRNIGLHYEWYGFLNDHFWQDIALFILAFGTSMLFWKRHGWNKQEKARYFCLFSGMFSLFSVLIIVAAIRTDSQNFWLLGLLIFFITSLLIATAIHFVTLQTKYVLLESIKIIFLGIVASGIILFSNLFVSRPFHGGDTGAALFFVFLFLSSVVIVFITSLIINFIILKKQLRRKI
jgi:small-conductance mechanosensitive channel